MINADDFTLGWVPAKALGRFTQLVSGHMPDQSSPDQVLASFTMQQAYGVRVGTVIRVPLYAASQLAALNNAVAALPPSKGPTVSLRVVGIEAAEIEFPAGQSPVYDLYVTGAFARSVMPRTANYPAYVVRLHHGTADYALFQAEAKALGVAGAPTLGTPAALVESSVHPQAIGWWVLAVLAGLAGLAVISQALSRQSVVEGQDYPTYGALGLSTRQLSAARDGTNHWRRGCGRRRGCRDRRLALTTRARGRSALGRAIQGFFPRQLGPFRRRLGQLCRRGAARPLACIAGRRACSGAPTTAASATRRRF